MSTNLNYPHKPSTYGSLMVTMRQCTNISAPLALLLALNACFGPARPAVGTVGAVTGFAGAAIADEPRAVMTARDVLSAGGTAADAAVALGFTMAVTNPHAAGLGGGGVCVVHDRAANITETLEFYPGSSSETAKAKHPSAIPGLARGLYALHAKYGRLRWETLLTTAEHLARFGDSVSRSLATDLATSGEVLSKNAEARRVFIRADGKVLGEGEAIAQFDLAGTMARLRVHGPGDLYVGVSSRELLAAVTAVGGSLTREDLRDYKPRWVPTVAVSFDDNIAHFAPAPAAGEKAGAIWAKLTSKEVVANVSSLQKTSTPVTGFVIADREGSAVACNLTMNAPFGTGIIAAGTGILLAVPTPPRDIGYPTTPMMVVKRHVNEVVAATVPTGRTPVVAPMLKIMAETVQMRKPLTQAMTTSGINAIVCAEGLPPFPASCRVASDVGGAGLAIIVGATE